MFFGLKKSLLILFLILSAALSLSLQVKAADPKCPGFDEAPPPVLKVDLPQLISALENLKDTHGRTVWKTTDETKASLKEIFEPTTPRKKLEQFFQLMFLI